MSAKSDKLNQTHSQQLAEFAEQLQSQLADESLLDDIHKAMQEMLWDNQSIEADIRRTLDEQHKAGNVRDETLELVYKMLDRMVTEHVETEPSQATPAQAPVAPKGNDPFVDTAVLETLSIDEEPTGDRLQVGSILRDRYLLQERIAGGSMGVVYKAMDRRLAEADDVSPTVAIKVLAPELSRDGNALRALQQEAAKGRCLTHANIVRFIDLDREDETYFIVMEWLEGRSLASILDDNATKKIDKATALDIIKQIGKALDYAHLRGVIHADVKPGNIMLLPNGGVKLFDFGVARIRQKHADGNVDFDPGVLAALTPAYSSMQVLTGEEPTAADDVFSLGCLMYRLIAGYRVFGPRNAAEAAESGMEPQRPQNLNDEEWAGLRKALSFSRVSRYASPKQFVEALSGAVSLEQTQPVSRLDEPEDEKRTHWPSLFAAAVLAGGLYGLYMTGMLDQIISLAAPDATTNDVREMRTEQTPVTEPEVIEEPVAEDPEIFAENETLVIEEDGELLLEDELPPEEEIIDFSKMPIATVEIPLALPGTVRTELDLTLRENGAPAIVDLVRESGLSDELIVRLEEVGFSGNRSPWQSGQYQISDQSRARFPPGQNRARITISMTPDPLREPDRQVSLLIRNYDDSESELALINLRLEDDDQRSFESGLGPNTVAFAVGQVSVQERDPAVQIDVVRFNPDQTALMVEYTLREVTATEGEDYFAPGVKTIHFGPGQRSARILIPLVQDSRKESDEAFVLEIANDQAVAGDANIFRRIAVMIRDDDSNPE